MPTQIEAFANRLCSRAPLSDDDLAAIASLPYINRTIQAKASILDEGEAARPYCSLIASGMAYRHKLTTDGARQIVSFHMPGDLLDLQQCFLTVADHGIRALTAMEILDIDRRAIQELVLTRPAAAYALWVDGLIDASISREWVLNVGRRDGRAKIAHLLCEIAVRMRASGLIDGHDFRLPMTQEQLGDATGVTTVHVNRTMKWLANDGLIHQSGRNIVITDWNALCKAGGFDPTYLHLDQKKLTFDLPEQAPMRSVRTDGRMAQSV